MVSSKLVFPAILFGLILVVGFWVAKTAKPYPLLPFTLHKLIALGFVVIVAIDMVKSLKNIPLGPLWIVVLALACLSVIALFATGGLMSGQKTDRLAWLWIHRSATLVLAGSAVALFLRWIH